MVEETIENAHKHALSCSLAPDERVGPMSRLTWLIWKKDEPTFILPDCIAICVDQNYKFSPLAYEEVKTIYAALTPLSPNRLLIGIKSGSNLDCNAYVEAFNAYAARCSNAFFVSSYMSNRLEDLKGLIGTNSSGNLEEKSELALREALNKTVTF